VRASIASSACGRELLAEFRERLLQLGFDPVASTPEHFAAWIRTEIAKWAKVIRDGNISVQ
jgi:tripartite-type tricarboxylate transporter receptor subunit TctC